MKKILILTPELNIGGAEKIIIDIILGLKSKYAFSVASGKGYYSELLKEHNIPIFSLPSVQSYNIQEVTRLYLFVLRILKKEQPDIVHTHHRMLNFIVGSIPLKKYKHLHTMHCYFEDKRFLTYLIKPDHTVAVGKNVYQSLCRIFHYPEHKCSIIQNGVPIVSGGNKRQTYGKIKKILCIGRLETIKGQQYLLEAMELLKDLSAQVFFIGDGADRNFLENKAERLGLSKNVFFMGTRHDITEQLNNADLLVLPSLGEGLPLVPIEALACGLPVIATDVGGTGEIILDHQTGLLIPPKSSVAIADAIRSASEHFAEMCTYAKRGQAHVKSSYSIEAMLHKYDSLYRKYLND